MGATSPVDAQDPSWDRDARDRVVMTWHGINWCVIAAISFSFVPCSTKGPACLEPLALLGSLLTAGLVTFVPALFHGLLVGAVLSGPIRRKPLNRVRPWAVAPTIAVGIIGAWTLGLGGSVREYAVWYAAAAVTYAASIMLRAARLPNVWAPAGECASCRYDLTGLPADAPCPECGVQS
mgnify:CR=1 FL=1